MKVQYPEVERFFRMDASTFRLIFRYVNPEMEPFIKAVEDAFAQEFDYRLEGACLREMVDEVLPHFEAPGSRYRGVFHFPTPVDARHPRNPPALAARGKCLVTKRVLVMDRCEGETLTKIGRRLLAEFAAAQGKTADQLNAEIQDRIKHDPKFVEDMLNKHVPTAAEVAAYRQWLRARDCVRNAAAFAYNWTLGWVGSPIAYEWKRLPPNGPAIMKQLYDMHGYQLFAHGSFNADCHAGNVLLDEATNELSLIDYGQLIGPLSRDERVQYARLMIAQDDGDHAQCRRSYEALGFNFVWKPTGEVNPPHVCYAIACLHFGGSQGLQHALKALGFVSLADLLGPEMAEKFDIGHINENYVQVQRCVMILKGVGDSIGAMGLPPTRMLRPSAERFLEAQGEPARDPALAGVPEIK